MDARARGSLDAVAELLAPGVRYWDCVRGDVHGRREAAAALLEVAGADGLRRTPAATVAHGARAVVELRTTAFGDERPLTEVYAFDAGGVAACRAYFDPGADPSFRG